MDIDENILLFLIYFAALILLICAFKFSIKNKNIYKYNLIVFGLYTALIFLPTLNAENLKYGSSLYFIVFGWIFLLLHFLVLSIILLWRYFKGK